MDGDSETNLKESPAVYQELDFNTALFRGLHACAYAIPAIALSV
jgi:uncharacterized protein YjaG (DUF416 family)